MEQPIDVQPLDYPLHDSGVEFASDATREDDTNSLPVEELEKSASLTYAMLRERYEARQPITEAMIRRAHLNLDAAQRFPLALSASFETAPHHCAAPGMRESR